MARETRLIESPRGGTVTLGQHSSMRLLAGSMGAAQAAGADGPLDASPATAERFEAPIADDAAWAAQVRAREAAEGLPVHVVDRFVNPPIVGVASDHLRHFSLAPGSVPPGDWKASLDEEADLSPLPDAFALEIERKPDGMWKVTAPSVHVGLFVADRDLGSALARAPGVLAEIVRLDGVVARPRTGRRAKP